MQNQRRGNPARSGATETKAPARGREADPNKDLLIFVLTSLVGQKVTAKLRDNVIYEGIFHSFSADNDYAIVLKSARKLASEMSKSGKVMDALVIPGKDFLQVSALDVPSPAMFDKEQDASTSTGFKTDTEISQKANTGGERDLVAWAGAEGTDQGELADMSMKSSGRNGGQWDQFEANEQMFGVSTTFNEELYTTPLDPSLIPRAKREEADRLAREIESGNNAAEKESSALDGEDDEEGRFSAVHGTGAYKKKDGWGNNESSATAAAKARGANGKAAGPAPDALEALRERREARQEDALSGALDPRAKRALAGNSPSMKTSMISEMKRINALNLEPAVPKLEDKTGNDLAKFQEQARNAANKAAGGSLKMEFQQSLEVINRREASKNAQQQARQQQQDAQANSSGDNWRSGGGKGGGQLSLPPEAVQQGNSMQQQQQQRGGGNMQQMGGGTGDSTRSKFSFNPNAKDFTFNPGAVSFTPGGSATGGGGNMAAPQPAGANPNAQAPVPAPSKTMTPSPAFNMFSVNSQSLSMKLDDILDCFCNSSKSEALGVDPGWPEAQGPSYHEVLGQPNPANPLPPVNIPQPMGAPWQQQQQQQQPMGQAPPGAPVQGGAGAAPQMMPQQNFMVAPGGQGNMQQGVQGQMFQPMYQGPGGQMPPGQRPQGGNNMPPQDQQPMGFNQQNMSAPQMGPGQQGMQAVPSGMVNAQGAPMQGGFAMQPMPGGAMPKFPQGMQMVMVPPGHYPQQFQQQGQPGQPGPQPGAPPGGPQPQGHWQQTQMMPVQMMQGGPRGPPHPMGGHDG